jgi:hypothetical protein
MSHDLGRVASPMTASQAMPSPIFDPVRKFVSAKIRTSIGQSIYRINWMILVA